jgi:hypothetical protein
LGLFRHTAGVKCVRKLQWGDMKVDHPDATLTEAAGVRDLPRIDALAPVKCAETFLSASRACFEPIQYFGTKISNVHGIASYC